MNDPVRKGAMTGSTIALVALGSWVVANGEKLAAVAQALWLWLVLVWEKMPASWASYLAAWALGLAVMYALRRWIPDPGQGNRYNNWRAAVVEGTSGVASFLVVALQVDDLSESMVQLAFGLTCALTVPLSYRLIGAAVELVCHLLRPADPS
jgi:hypothetical protein